METYNFIFAGAGCAGLSMVHYLLKSKLKDAKILIVDSNFEIPNKTWCYWSETPLAIHTKENIISWNSLYLESKDKKIKKKLGDLKYHHLTSLDFYSSIHDQIAQSSNVTLIQDQIISIKTNGSSQMVETTSGKKFKGEIIFDSRINEAVNPKILKQIFLGWKIKAPNPCFNRDGVTFMNFVESKDKFDFFYILPFSDTEALIEYTVFSKESIENSTLETKLTDYLRSKYHLKEFEKVYEESGVIPMTTTLNKKQKSSSIIKIGTAAGWIKASTGFGFYSIQKKCERIVNQLESGKPIELTQSRRFEFYDNILLNIAHKWPEKLQSVFFNLFETSPSNEVLKFLSEETSISEEIRLLSRLKFNPFIQSLMNYARH